MSIVSVKKIGINAYSRNEKNGIVLPVIALILPVFFGISFAIFNQAVEVARVMGYALVIVTTVLMAWDSFNLGETDVHGKKRTNTLFLTLMLLLWPLGFVLAFFRRRHFGGPNLGIPAFLVILFLCGFPVCVSVINSNKPSLPTCDGLEVVNILVNYISSLPIGQKKPILHSYQMVNYNSITDCKRGKFFIKNENVEHEIYFVVEWLNRNEGKYQVRVEYP